MKKHIFVFFVAIMVLFCVLFGLEKKQEQIPPEKHEVEVRLVLVDVVVTRDGKFVTDLTKDDFELYEDGKRVPINSFELIAFEKKELETKEEKVSPEIPRKQLIVLFDGICSWQRNLKEGSRMIVDQLVSLTKLGNEVMILQMSEKKGLEILQPFTADEQLIRKALILASGNIWLDKSLDALKMREEVGIESTGDMAEIDRHAEQIHPTLEQEFLFRERRRFEKAMGGIFALSNMIKHSPGRKTILLISDGIPDTSSKTLDSIITETTSERTVSGARTPHLDMRRDTGNIRIFDPFNILQKKKIMSGEEIIRELIRFANAQNISVYALDPDTFTKYFMPTSAEYGPKSDMRPHDLRAQEKLKRLSNLRWIAEDTGGISLKGAKKYERFFEVLSTDLNYYYQLSFYPQRKEPDSEYHKIKVEVRRSGVDVRSRKGYTDYAEDEKERILLVSAFYTPRIFKQLPLEAEFVPFHKDKEKYEPWMNIGLPVKELFIERAVEYGTKVFNFHFWIKDKNRGERAFGGQINIPFNIDSNFMDVIKTTDYLCFHFKGGEINFSQKEYDVIFALYDNKTEEIGTWESSLTLPDLKEKRQGSIMSCVLGFISQNPKKGKKNFSLSQKDGTLEYGELKFFPAVTNRFQRMQDAALFMQVHLPRGKTKIQPKFRVSGKGRLSQRVPGELIAETWNKKAKVWSGLFNLQLRTVIYGDYTLKVEIPVSKEGPGLSREVKMTKLRY